MSTDARARIVIEAVTRQAIAEFQKVSKGLSEVEKRAQALEKQQQAVSKTATAMGVGLSAAAAAGGAFLYSATRLAARVETLGVVVDVVGRNAGFSTDQMRSFEKGIISMGITTQASRQALALMGQAQIDFTKGTDLARIAQDAAVIANVNSSEAFTRLIYVIQTGNLRMARNLGLVVDFQKAYENYAESVGKSAMELTQQEKVMIRTNTVIERGATIAGTYAAAMETAGKKVLSLDRHIEESRKIIGEAFLPAFAEAVDAITASLVKWEELNTVQQYGISTAVAAGVAYTALAGVVFTVIGNMTKLVGIVKSANLAFAGSLGPVTIFAAALGLAIVEAVKFRAEIARLKDLQDSTAKSALDSKKAYTGYRLEMQAIADETDKTVVTQEQYNEMLVAGGRVGMELADVIVIMTAEEYNHALALQETQERMLELSQSMEEADARGHAYWRSVNLAGEATEDFGEKVDEAREPLRKFITPLQAIADAATETFSDTNTAIGSTIEKMKDAIAWTVGGGKIIEDNVAKIFEAWDAEAISADEATQLLNDNLVAAHDLAADLGMETTWDAKKAVADGLGIPISEAAKALTDFKIDAGFDMTSMLNIDIIAHLRKGSGWGGVRGDQVVVDGSVVLSGTGGLTGSGRAARKTTGGRYQHGGQLRAGEWSLVGDPGPFAEMITPWGYVIDARTTKKLMEAGVIPERKLRRGGYPTGRFTKPASVVEEQIATYGTGGGRGGKRISPAGSYAAIADTEKTSKDAAQEAAAETGVMVSETLAAQVSIATTTQTNELRKQVAAQVAQQAEQLNMLTEIRDVLLDMPDDIGEATGNELIAQGVGA